MSVNETMASLEPPALNEPISPQSACPATLDLMIRRRSLTAKDMGPEGPSEGQIRQLLQIAARVPDHGKLAPWRFILFQNDARARFGEHLARAFEEDEPKADADRVEFERSRFLRAPLVIGVISSLKESPKIPDWEQILSAGAACQNLLIAANAMGFAAQWLTEWYAYDDRIRSALGLNASERVAGFVYVGAPGCEARERARADLQAITHVYDGVEAAP